MSWRKRQGPENTATEPGVDDVPVPEWLENSLFLWLSEFFYESDYRGTRPNVAYCLAVERLLKTRLVNPNEGTLHGPPSAVMNYLKAHPSALWQVVEERLTALSALQSVGYPHIGTETLDAAEKIKQLRIFLIQAGAGYEVAMDHRQAYLRRRIPGGVQAVTNKAEEAVANSSALLRSAMRHTYGREPDYGSAYADAIRAVEAAAIPVVLPNDGLATLGKVIGQMGQSLGAWSLALGTPRV